MPETGVLSLNRSGLRTISDVTAYNVTTNKNYWLSSPLLPPLMSLPTHITQDPNSLTHINLQTPSIKPQQSWCVSPYTHVIEILGWDRPPATGARVTPTHMHAVSYTHLTLPTNREV